MKNLLLSILAVSLTVTLSISQELQVGSALPWPKSAMRPEGSTSARTLPSDFVSPKRPGHYTAKDWRFLIDSLWGPGLPTATKLEIFDTFWGRIDREFGGFPHLEVNWDSLNVHYRPEIEAGVSRGRFAAIMGQLFLALKEIHTFIYDAGLDSVGGVSVFDAYIPGVPHFYTSGWGWAGNFGAALTPMPDSSLLVYRVVASHPLGLVPGDIVLGYDRIPWKRLYRELLAAELPIQWFDEMRWGSSPRSMTHALLSSAGANWGLFDTIDVVKYASGDTLHLPTAPLTGLDWYSLFATEQIEVPGIPMAQYAIDKLVSSGVVENTSIGYVYVYAWPAIVAGPFAEAIRDLVVEKKVTGLILDFRYNRGGSDAAAAGLDYLFNQNPAGSSRWRSAIRNDPKNHLGFSYNQPFDAVQTMRPDYFDRPIAVLLGPHAMSFGDLTAFRVRFHPMARLFGLPTNGAYVTPSNGVSVGPRWGTWYYSFRPGQMQSLIDGEGFLMHKCFPVDEEIWLTREGVANGEDDVVNRALEWIETLTHAHTLSVTPRHARPGLDTVTFTATLANPQGHQAAVSLAYSPPGGGVRDSFALYNDGLHGDGLPGDSLWGARFLPLPSLEGFYAFDLRTDDMTAGDYREMPAAGLFTTAGPVACIGDTANKIPAWGATVSFLLKIANNGSSATIPDVRGTLRAIETAATVISGAFTIGDLAPGQVRQSGVTTIAFSQSGTGTQDIAFELVFSSQGIEYWRDTLLVKVTEPTGIVEKNDIPANYELGQNYPNPFNPTTTIEYALPCAGDVSLKVYNVLGEEVATLVDEERPAGRFKAEWDASAMPSGQYFFQLRSGEYVQARAMVLLR